MCLDIDVRYHPNAGKKGSAFIAQQPIFVHKRLIFADMTSGFAPYQGTRWDFGVEKRVRNFTYWGSQRQSVKEGLHLLTGCFRRVELVKDADQYLSFFFGLLNIKTILFLFL